tara:strand:+ start:330 stop:758 length:429 start_codon:yes stop_codon:yes gene_type:complete
MIVKNIDNVDSTYFLLFFICVFFIILYGRFRFIFKDENNKKDYLFLDGEPLFTYGSFEFDKWHITHIVFYALLGFLYPKTFYFTMFLGIIWEIIEFYIGYSKPKWVFDYWKNSTEWWFGRNSDIVVNLIGFIIGMKLRKVLI